MKEATLADLRRSSKFFQTDQIIHIVNGRKKEEIGYFIPSALREDFIRFLEEVEKKRKEKLLKRVAEASRRDPIGDGAVDDGVA